MWPGLVIDGVARHVDGRGVHLEGGAPCCCGQGGGLCCQKTEQYDCDGTARCCSCGVERIIITNARVQMAYSFSGNPQRLFIDSRFQKRVRFTCDPTSGAVTQTVESVVVDGTVRAAIYNGNFIDDTGLSGVAFTGGRDACPPDIDTTLFNATAAYQIGVDAVVNAFVARYGSFDYSSSLFPVPAYPGSVPLFAGYNGGCNRSYGIEGLWVTPALIPVTSPGSLYVFIYNQSCQSSNYQSGGTVAVNFNSTPSIPGTFSWDIASSSTIQVLRPCVPDPCDPAPPPPPPPPPGMGACCLQDGTCVISTAQDCYNQRYGAFLRFNDAESCDSCFGGRGGCANCGDGGGL